MWRWDAIRTGAARGLAISLLRGVGHGQDFWKRGESAMHLRRQLSDEEVAGLPPEWMALPAIDEAG